MTTTSRKLRVLPALLALALAAACGGSDSPADTPSTTKAEAKVGGTITYGADQEPTGFNSGTSKDNGTASTNVLNGVLPSAFFTKPDFSVVMDRNFLDSAELTNESPQTVVYKIKKEAVWSDGVPMTVKDFEVNWKGLNGTNKKLDVAGTTGYEDIQSVTGSDNGKTVTMVYKKPYPEWKSLFSLMRAGHILESLPGGFEKAWNTGFDKTTHVSGGPFMMGVYKPTSSLTLVRNDKYWGPKANLDSVVFRFLPESSTQQDALKNGEVDVIYPQPQLDLVAAVKGIPNVKSETNFGLTFEHFDFNTKTPGLDDVAVRKAIAAGLDIKAILARTVGQFSDKAQPLGNRIYVNSQKEYVDNGGDNGKGDVTAAKKLLTDAGYTQGADGIFAKNGKKLSFRLSTTAGNQLREIQGELFKSQMKEVGVEIKIDNSAADVLFGKRLPAHDFDIANFAWVSSPFAAGNKDIYGTGGGSNYGQFSNPAVDAAFNEAGIILDDTKRAAKYNEIDKLIWDGMATIPLYQKPTFIAYSDKYVNIGDNASSTGPFWNVGEWGLKK